MPLVGIVFVLILKSYKMPKKFVRICPKCKSMDLSIDLSVQSYARGSFFNQFKCNKCGYSEIFFPEVLRKLDRK